MSDHAAAIQPEPRRIQAFARFFKQYMNVSSVIALQANVDWTQRGAALSSVFFSRLIGQSFGSAVFGGIFNAGLADHGNMSSPTVLFVLDRILCAGLPPRTLLTAMGPGFNSSCVSLKRAA